MYSKIRNRLRMEGVDEISIIHIMDMISQYGEEEYSIGWRDGVQEDDLRESVRRHPSYIGSDGEETW